MTQLACLGECGVLLKTRHDRGVIPYTDHRIAPRVGKNVLSGSLCGLRPFRFRTRDFSRIDVPVITRARIGMDTEALANTRRTAGSRGLGDRVHRGRDPEGPALAREGNAVYPILDRIHRTGWDGARRVETYFIDHLGTPDHPYDRKAVPARFLNPASQNLVPSRHSPDRACCTGPTRRAALSGKKIRQSPHLCDRTHSCLCKPRSCEA